MNQELISKINQLKEEEKLLVKRDNNRTGEYIPNNGNTTDRERIRAIRKELKELTSLMNQEVEIPQCYQYADDSQRFIARMKQLFELGFVCYNGCDFELKDIWGGVYWEKLNGYDETEWKEYMEAIHDAIERKTGEKL